MIDALPFYVTVVFALTTLLTLGFFLRSFSSIRPPGVPSQLLTFAIPFWMLLTGVLALGGFYQRYQFVPPRVFGFAILPALLLITLYFFLFRQVFIDRLSLRLLTLLHVVRIPVELVLLWLMQAGLIPRIMTFEGLNFDILSGLSAPIIYWLAFRGQVQTKLLIVWNMVALALLVNIVVIAVLSFPSPMQKLGLEQPNVGITYFPFIWLASIIVPVVLFAHLASLWKLNRGHIS